MMGLSRRDFLTHSSGLAAATAFTPFLVSRQEACGSERASDRLKMGCIGVGSMGKQQAANGFNDLCDIVAVCDADTRHMAECQEHPSIGAKGRDGKKLRLEEYRDYRRILDRRDIDVVAIATPDHWHVKIAIEALMAGKHVHCQKPLTLTIEEGQLIRAAAKKSDRVFQVGTQQRSQRKEFLTAILMVQKGFLGNIQRVVCDVGSGPISPSIPLAAVPDTLDFDLWLGQAPKEAYRASSETYTEFGKYTWPRNSRTHYEFRWWYEYSGGKFTDWGAHHVDIALWALDQNGPGQGPTKYRPIIAEHPVPFKDGYPTLSDRYNACTKFSIDCSLPNGTILNVCSQSPDGNGILFQGTQGSIHVNRGRIKGKRFEVDKVHEAFKEEDFEALYHGKPVEGHQQNFFTCIREGGTPVSDVFTHVQAMNVCHICSIAARLGRELHWDPKDEKFVGDDQAQSFVARERRVGFEIPRV